MAATEWTHWGALLARRLLFGVAAMLGVTLIVFVVSHLLGDPVYLILGERATPEQYEALRHSLGYDRPLWVQYGDYVWQLLHGNLGTSRYTLQPVAHEIWQRFPATFELTLAAMLLGVLWTIPLGVLSAIRPRGIVDRVSQAIVEFGVAMPSFWLGLLLIYLFYYLLNLAPSPVGQLDISATAPPRVTGLVVVDSLVAGQFSTALAALAHLALPAITLSLTACPPILQLTRNSMLHALRSEYIRSARSLGLPERVIYWRYALRNALLPVLTMTAMTFGYLLGGTVLVEAVFSWPGIGLYAVQSMQHSDYEPVVGIALLASAIYILVYMLADVLSLLVDPRVRETM
jgi:peptide/nickel transport system permease protein